MARIVISIDHPLEENASAGTRLPISACPRDDLPCARLSLCCLIAGIH
jgi:hypothetical protein